MIQSTALLTIKSWFFVAFCVLFTLGCTQKTPSSTPANPVAQESGSGQGKPETPVSNTTPTPSAMLTTKVAVGKTIQIQLEDKPMPDYVWYYHVSEDWVISMTEPYAYPSKGTGQAPVEDQKYKIFDVKGLKKGEVTIRFYKVKPWESTKKPVEEVFYKVEVEG
jgi:predicted secreted protein